VTATDEILLHLAGFSSDPVGFVYFAFPWGELDTELAGVKGPEAWQLEILKLLRDGLLTIDGAIRLAVASGHGVGKSALVSWIILWAMSTFTDTRGVVTANTENQLKTKTWVELDKWYRLFIARDFFDKTATKICARDPEHAESWRIDVVPWSERNTEAFAGLHNKGKRLVLIFDEASAIPDIIWETSEGALTDSDTQIIWAAFGNPTKSTGRFRECFAGGRFSAMWQTRQVDARTVSLGNQKQFAEWIRAYGEDSDFVRVRILGVFPRQGDLEFISIGDVDDAKLRDATHHPFDPLIFGVDVARFGGDASCVFIRKGRDARSFPYKKYRGLDTMQLASRVAELYEHYKPAAIFVDEGGVGGGVVDRLRQIGVPIIGVQFGSKPDRANLVDDATKYANKRSEMWGFMRSDIRNGLALPDDKELSEELVGPHYSFNASDAIQLERKVDMKKRGLASPDIADALALTYAYPVITKPAEGRRLLDTLVETEYDPFAKEYA
jgi:hypothetical protein